MCWHRLLLSSAFNIFQSFPDIPSILLRHEVMSYRNDPQRASVLARLLQLISWIRYWQIRAAPELPSSSVFQHRNVWPLCLICRSTWVKTVLFWLNFWLVFYSISLFYDFIFFCLVLADGPFTVQRNATFLCFPWPVMSCYCSCDLAHDMKLMGWGGVGWGMLTFVRTCTWRWCYAMNLR